MRSKMKITPPYFAESWQEILLSIGERTFNWGLPFLSGGLMVAQNNPWWILLAVPSAFFTFTYDITYDKPKGDKK